MNLRIVIDVGIERPTPADADLHLRIVGQPWASAGRVGGRRSQAVHVGEATPPKPELRQILAAALYGN